MAVPELGFLHHMGGGDDDAFIAALHRIARAHLGPGLDGDGRNLSVGRAGGEHADKLLRLVYGGVHSVETAIRN